VRILAFDTASRATTVALLDADARIAVEARDDPPAGARPRHMTRLMSLIVEVLERGGLDWADLDRLAVGVGPGTFTGLRIGVATAHALARARAIPLVGVSTLESLALGAVDEAQRSGADVVLAVLDARRGEVFAAPWPVQGLAAAPRAPLLDPRAWAPSALAQAAADVGARRLGIGDGAVEFRAALDRPGTSIPEDDSRLHLVSAINHCRLASEADPARPGDVRPTYLRVPDAELALQAAQP
jgi:tRNA threonylcarbamoyladenosine biosynthesis protein TsaB